MSLVQVLSVISGSVSVWIGSLIFHTQSRKTAQRLQDKLYVESLKAHIDLLQAELMAACDRMDKKQPDPTFDSHHAIWKD